jgi:radical SAM protein with 4Fe4S-binding SPASM domain
MDLALFEKIMRELKGKSKEIALHVMGDPLLNKNLRAYLDIAAKFSHRVVLTTSGFYFDRHDKKTLFHETILQINISLNSFNKNAEKMTLKEYLEPIFELIEHRSGIFINLRLLNGEKLFNAQIFDAICTRFGVKTDEKNIQIAPKVRLHFDELFCWPSLNAPVSEDSKCYGLNRQIAILSNGKVTPCCFDYEAKVLLGDANYESLSDILRRSSSIALGLKSGAPTEELCRRCTYRLRFKEF